MQSGMIMILALSFLLGCAGCAKTMGDAISGDPRFTGTVKEVHSDHLIVLPHDGETVGEPMRVSLDTALRDSGTFEAGDEVSVYYDGLIRGNMPDRVTAIVRHAPVFKG